MKAIRFSRIIDSTGEPSFCLRSEIVIVAKHTPRRIPNTLPSKPVSLSPSVKSYNRENVKRSFPLVGIKKNPATTGDGERRQSTRLISNPPRFQQSAAKTICPTALE